MSFFDKKVLVVEDDGMLRDIVMQQLAMAFTVIAAKDGQEALEKIEADKPDVLVLDLLLPKVDGFEVLQKLRAMPDPKFSKMPVLIVSNLSDKKSVEKAKSLFALEYYIKSDIKLGLLVNRIKRIFNSGAV